MKEQWKEFPLGYKSRFRYAISNHGRLKSFSDDINKGRILNCSSANGYKFLRYAVPKTKIEKCLFIYKLVAIFFLPNPDNKTHVLHLDYDSGNNHIDNLKWATKKEMIEHREKSPSVMRGHLRTIERKRQLGKGQKLTATKVQFIKKKIFDPNYKIRLKILARQFGVTEQTLYRIKWGENWGHIK